MNLFFLVLLPCSLGATQSTLEGLIPAHKTAKCVIGEVLQNDYVRCICKQDHFYHCIKRHFSKEKLKKIENQNNILLGKPMKAICKPKMVYIQNYTTCVCNKYGYWPHDKCERMFKSLYKTVRKSKTKCQPDTYVIVGCNVCRCGANGFIDATHCTKNDCNDTKIKRRALANLHDSCEPSSWYSLAPCQFCYCVNENKLVCSTGNSKNNNMLELGAYNLTVCGKELLKEVIELIPDGQRALRVADNKITTTAATTTTITTPPPLFRTTVTASSIAYENDDRLNYAVEIDANVIKTGNPVPGLAGIASAPEEYDSPSEETNQSLSNTTPIRSIPLSTMLPYDDTEIIDNDNENENENEDSNEQEIEPLYIQQPAATSPTPAPAPIVVTTEMTTTPSTPPRIHQIIEASTTPDPNIVRIHLPSVLDKLLQMALRKSMVKLSNAGTKCTPGETTNTGCNYCYCLTNGKLLCTDKQC